MVSLIREEMIFDNVHVASGEKEEALRIISRLCAKKDDFYGDKFLEAFQKRENMDSTGFGGGIAIPHAIVEGLPAPIFAIVRFSCPVEWESIDGKPVYFVMAAITPECMSQSRHLPMIAALARKLMNEEFVYHLRRCEDKEQIYSYIVEEMGRQG